MAPDKVNTTTTSRSSLITLDFANHHERLVGGLWTNFKTGHRTDLAYNGGRVHRLIAELFLSPDKLSRTCDDLDFCGQELCHLLEFLYKGTLTVEEDQLGRLLESARKLDFFDLENALLAARGVGKFVVETEKTGTYTARLGVSADEESTLPRTVKDKFEIETVQELDDSGPKPTRTDKSITAETMSLTCTKKRPLDALNRLFESSDDDEPVQKHRKSAEFKLELTGNNSELIQDEGVLTTNYQGSTEIEQDLSPNEKRLAGNEVIPCSQSELTTSDKFERQTPLCSVVGSGSDISIINSDALTTTTSSTAASGFEPVWRAGATKKQRLEDLSKLFDLSDDDERPEVEVRTPTEDDVAAEAIAQPQLSYIAENVATVEPESEATKPHLGDLSVLFHLADDGNEPKMQYVMIEEINEPSAASETYEVVLNSEMEEQSMEVVVEQEVYEVVLDSVEVRQEPIEVVLEPQAIDTEQDAGGPPQSKDAIEEEKDAVWGVMDSRHHECSVCGKAYTRLQSLYVHRQTHQPNSNVCDICGKTFSQKSHLSAHVKVHIAAKTFACSVCNKIFRRAAAVRRHFRMHSGGERNHQCNLCPKSFFDGQHLRNHLLTHTKEKLHDCGLCGKKFTRKHHLTNHMRVHKA